MIGQCLAPDQIGPFGTQRGEKPGGISNPGECKNPRAAPVHAHRQRFKLAPQARQGNRLSPECVKAGLRLWPADGQDKVGPRKPGGDRLAQGAGGNAAAIAKAFRGIDNHQPKCRLDRRVLEPVVHQHDASTRRLGSPDPGRTVP